MGHAATQEPASIEHLRDAAPPEMHHGEDDRDAVVRNATIVGRRLEQRADGWGKAAFTTFAVRVCLQANTAAPSAVSREGEVPEPFDMASSTISDSTASTSTNSSTAPACAQPALQTWVAFRRYSAFRDLHLHLQALNSVSPMPPFPGRRILGSSFEGAFLDVRQRALQIWLQQLVRTQSSICGCAQLLDDFLRPGPSDDDACAAAAAAAATPATAIAAAAARAGTCDMTLARSGVDAGLHVPRHVQLQDFELLRVVGQGSFGRVAVARLSGACAGASLTGGARDELFAIKALRKRNLRSRKQAEHAKTERRVMAALPPHPFIATLFAAFQTRSRLFLVLEFVPGGELFFHLGRLKRFPERAARVWTAELLLALAHLHARDVMFRDLKPENVLLDARGHARLIDFGLCKDGVRDGVTGASSFCGTPEYLAPEILARRGHGKAVDFWSLGMVLFEMLVGLPPWYSRNKRKLFERIRAAPLRFPDGAGSGSDSAEDASVVGAAARDLIAGLLVRDPRDRLGNRPGGFSEVRAHAFFAELDWDAVLRQEEDPGFRPALQAAGAPHGLDTSNFDAAFTAMALRDGEDSDDDDSGEGGDVLGSEPGLSAVADDEVAADAVARALSPRLDQYASFG